MVTENEDIIQILSEDPSFDEEDIETIINPQHLDDETLQNARIEDAKQIPLDKCSPEEQLAIAKCINKQTLTEKEEETLINVLERYSKAIQTQKPTEILENYEKNKEYIEAEKTFLELIKEQKKENKTIKLDYPLNDGSIKTITLQVFKADSTIISEVQKDLGMFSDFTPAENKVRVKQEQGTPLTPEEQDILENIQNKLSQKVDENPMDLMIEFLAKTTRIQEEPFSDYEYMKQVYANIDFYILEPLFDRVSRMTGIVTPNADKLFH